MKTVTKYFIGIILIYTIGISCERKYEFNLFDCEDCYQEKPEYGPLKLYFTIDDNNAFVPYTIYKGNFEDCIEEYTDTAFYPEEEIDVPVNQYYSVEAIYNNGDRVIHVVDGDKLKLKKETEQCDKDCYYYKGGEIDVRLKQ